jgi:hypothetical protein
MRKVDMYCCVVQTKLLRGVCACVRKTIKRWTEIMEKASRGSLSEARPWTSQIKSSKRKYKQLSFWVFFAVYWNKLTQNHEQRELPNSILDTDFFLSRLTGNEALSHIHRVWDALSNAKVTNAWSSTSISPKHLDGVVVRHFANFAFDENCIQHFI